MVHGVPILRFSFPLIKVRDDPATGEAFWSYLEAEFRYLDGILYVQEAGKWVPIVRIALRDQAIQFSLGMIAGSQYWICLGSGPPLN